MTKTKGGVTVALFSYSDNGGATLRAVCKIWLDSHGQAFGEGPYELLKGVEETNSLHQAALQMGMSYSKAWKLIQTMEDRLGFVLLHKKVGGTAGGGSEVTPKGKDLMKRYKRFEMEAIRAVEKAFRRHFDYPSGREEA